MSLLGIFSNLWYILIAVLVLLFMITVHELGHYAAGKILKFKINEFAIGMGPALFKTKPKKEGGEVFSIRALPLGGFCAFEGEDENSDSTGAFNNQKPWKRIIVLLSGVAMNFIVSLLIAAVVFTAAGFTLPKVANVFPDAHPETTVVSDAYKLQTGDLIVKLDGRSLYLQTDLSEALAKFDAGEVLTADIVRNGQRMTVQVQKRAYAAENSDGTVTESTGLGIGIDYDTWHFGFFESIGRAVQYCFRMAGVILGFFWQLITGGIKFTDLGGPVSTIDMTAQIARMGAVQLLNVVTLIGVNLAVFNALPIPALDGARVVFVVIEWIRGKPINRNLEGKIHFAGLIILFTFVIVADVLHYVL